MIIGEEEEGAESEAEEGSRGVCLDFDLLAAAAQKHKMAK